MQEPASGDRGFVYQRSLARKRFALLYAAGIVLILVLILIIIRLPLGIQPAAAVLFPVIMLASTALVFVLLVLAAPPVPGSRAAALEQSMSVIYDPAIAVQPGTGEILAVNDLAVDVFGARDSLVGKPVGVLAGDAPSRNIEEEATGFSSPAFTRLGYFTVRLATGSTRQLPVIARLGNIYNHDTVILVFRADEVDRALADFARVQERLMSNISHELRTPLNVVMGFSELLSSGTLGEMTEKQIDGAQEIRTGGQRMLDVVDDLLDIGRARNYGLETEPTATDVGDLVQRVRNLTTGTARREKVSLEFGIIPDLPAVYIDARTCKQMLYHLILGAIDRSATDGAVTLALEPTDDAVVVTISDTGKGLDEDDLAVLQSPPQDVPIGAEGLPMVLGLRLCSGLAGRMGFELNWKSNGAETTVSFALPRA